MPKPAVLLSVLIAREVPYEWHDAVALVSQLVAQTRSSDMARLPQLQLLALEENGTLSAAAPEPSVPLMPGAALILQELLSGTHQPAALRLWVMHATTSDPVPSLDTFMSELAKFERPGRTMRLEQLHGRAFALIGPDALVEAAREALARPLDVKTARRQTPADTAASPTREPADRKGATLRVASVVVITVAVAAAAAGGYAWYATHGPGSLSPSSEVVQAPAGTDTALIPEARAAKKADARREGEGAPALVSGSQPASAPEPFVGQEYAAASTDFNRVVEILGSEDSPQAEEIRRGASSLAEVARAAVDRAATATSIYRRGDPGVTDPVALSYLPPAPDPGTPAERLQVLELSIAPDGHVESAKFANNRPTFRNSWWASAAKAWRFQPAMKDGRPVRYAMRMVMADPGPR